MQFAFTEDQELLRREARDVLSNGGWGRDELAELGLLDRAVVYEEAGRANRGEEFFDADAPELERLAALSLEAVGIAARALELAVAGVSTAQCEAALRAAGFDVILAFDGMRFGGQFVSRLTLIGGEAGSLNTADLVEPRSSRYAHEVLARSLTGSLRQVPLQVVSPEDFVVMKVLATRERDLEDAVTVVRSLASRIDMELIEHELKALAIEIPDHDVMGRWQRARTK